MTGSPPVPITGLSPLPGGGSASGRLGVSGSRRATAATACWARKESGGPLRTVSRTVIASPYPSTPGDSAQRRPDEGERLGLEPRLRGAHRRVDHPRTVRPVADAPARLGQLVGAEAVAAHA